MPTREKDVRVEGRSRPRARKEHRELSISKAPPPPEAAKAGPPPRYLEARVLPEKEN